MDIIYEIRRRHLVQKQSISAIAREMGLSRPTVRKHLNTVDEPQYKGVQPLSPKLGEFEIELTHWLEEEAKLARPRRRSARRLLECLQEIGYGGAYDSIQRFVKRWKSAHHGPRLTQAFVPLLFVAGDACQFDWSQEQVELGGVLQMIKVAHFRLAYSRQMFVVAYPRETQEMVLEAHNRAFVELLMLAGESGLDALTVACELALECGIVSAPIVMNELRRLITPPSANGHDRCARPDCLDSGATGKLPSLRLFTGVCQCPLTTSPA